MDPTVTTALIAAISSLALAVYQTLRRRRDSAEIERLKSRLDHERNIQGEFLRRYLEYVVDGKQQELSAFRELLQLVQTLRDKVKAVARQPHSYDPQQLSLELRELAESIVQCFARNQTYFSMSNCEEAHKLKNLCVALANQLSECVLALSPGASIIFPDSLLLRQENLAVQQRRIRDSAFTATKEFADSLMKSALEGERDV